MCTGSLLLRVNQCLSACEPNYYASGANVCSGCDSTCYHCTGPSSTQCTRCSGTLYLLSNQCINYHTAGSTNTRYVCGVRLYGVYIATNNICYNCHSYCYECYGSANTQCYTCRDIYWLLVSSNTCQNYDTANSVYMCGANQYPVLTSTADGSRNCGSCHSTCYYCTGPSNTQCTLCTGSLSLRVNECLSVCDPNYYLSSANTCSPCDNTCYHCTGPSSTQCTRCSGTLYLLNNQCINYHTPGSTNTRYVCGVRRYGVYIATNNICYNCHVYCYECYGSANTQCYTCRDIYWLLVSSNTCQNYDTANSVYMCGGNQYPVLTSTADGSRNCASCHSACYYCTGPSLTSECDSCNYPYYKDYYARECHYNTTSNTNNWHYCKNNQYNENPGSHASLGQAARLCKPCDPRCSECFGPLDTNCNNCNTPTTGIYANIVFYKWLFFRSISLTNSYICSAQCPPQEQYPKTDNTCGGCHAYCYICSGPSNLQCSACYSSIPAYLHLSSQCLTACPTGYYSSNSSYLCYGCPAGCTACSANTTLACTESTCINTVFCTACGSGYIWIQGKCQITSRCREYSVDSGAALWSASSCSCYPRFYASSYLSCSLCYRDCLTCSDYQSTSCASCYDGAALSSGSCAFNSTYSAEVTTAFFGTFSSMPSGWTTNATSPYNNACGYGTILGSYGTNQLAHEVTYTHSSLGASHYALQVVFTAFFFDEWPVNGTLIVYHNRDGNTRSFIYDTKGVLGENLCGYNYQDYKFRYNLTFRHAWNDITLYFKANNQYLFDNFNTRYSWGLKDVAIRKLNCFGNCSTCWGP
jgi:proprotein convertase subtilisin/kexin type 5